MLLGSPLLTSRQRRFYKQLSSVQLSSANTTPIPLSHPTFHNSCQSNTGEFLSIAGNTNTLFFFLKAFVSQFFLTSPPSSPPIFRIIILTRPIKLTLSSRKQLAFSTFSRSFITSSYDSVHCFAYVFFFFSPLYRFVPFSSIRFCCSVLVLVFVYFYILCR